MGFLATFIKGLTRNYNESDGRCSIDQGPVDRASLQLAALDCRDLCRRAITVCTLFGEMKGRGWAWNWNFIAIFQRDNLWWELSGYLVMLRGDAGEHIYSVVTASQARVCSNRDANCSSLMDLEWTVSKNSKWLASSVAYVQSRGLLNFGKSECHRSRLVTGSFIVAWICLVRLFFFHWKLFFSMGANDDASCLLLSVLNSWILVHFWVLVSWLLGSIVVR